MFVKLDPVAHALGARIDDVLHMCPAEQCGYPPRAFCPTCLGVGLLTEEDLARWHRTQLAEAKGALPDRSDSAHLRTS